MHLQDTTLQYLEGSPTGDETDNNTTASVPVAPPKEVDNAFKFSDKLQSNTTTEFVLSRQEHVDKSISNKDLTSTDDQQSEASLGSYEILPNDDSESKQSTTTLTDGWGATTGGVGGVGGSLSPGGRHQLTPGGSSYNPPSSLRVVSGVGKLNPLQYKIGASSSAETPDEFHDSEEESTLKGSLSEGAGNNAAAANASNNAEENANNEESESNVAVGPPDGKANAQVCTIYT